MQICRNINTWKCNCWAISLDKQGQCCDKVHLTLYTVLSTATLSKATGLTSMCVSVSLFLCVCLTEPLRCSPPGLPDIISHYPRHSSNTAGAREHVCFTSTLPLHVYLPFSAALSLFRTFPCGPFQTQLPGGQEGCKFVHCGGASWCSVYRKK